MCHSELKDGRTIVMVAIACSSEESTYILTFPIAAVMCEKSQAALIQYIIHKLTLKFR